jgi:hypothetical protein
VLASGCGFAVTAVSAYAGAIPNNPVKVSDNTIENANTSLGKVLGISPHLFFAMFLIFLYSLRCGSGYALRQ